MDARGRIGLILPPAMGPWRQFNLERGFIGIAQRLAAEGFRPDLLCFDPPPADWPADGSVIPVPRSQVALLCGPGLAADTISLRCGHELWLGVREAGYEALIAPLCGGVLQPCLMSRSLGESLQDTAMLLWADTPTCLRAGDADAADVARQAVDDALERTCLAMADAIFAPGDAVLAQCQALGARSDTGVRARLPAPSRRDGETQEAEVELPTLYHLGPGTCGNGADRFMDAIEVAAELGCLNKERVAFVGPWRERGHGLSLELLGLRALRWPFRFTARSLGPEEAVLLPRPEHDEVAFCGGDGDDDMLVTALVARGISVTLSSDHRLAQCYPDLVQEPGRSERRTEAPDAATRELSADQIADQIAIARNRRAPDQAREDHPLVSLCIVHRDRPAMLEQALASCPPGSVRPHEIIVADAGSTGTDALALLNRLESRGIRVLRCGPIGHRPACDIMAREAKGDTLVFLDDDNAFREDGWARMALALATGTHDIVVTTLDLHQDLPPRGLGDPVARQLFLGNAHAAGLLFNSLGDSSLAIGRDTFHQIGGFGAYNGPSNDWVFLAKAAAAGLSIGVLQEPAVRYRLDSGAVHDQWRKHDGETARQAVLQTVANKFHSQFILLSALIKNI